MILAIRLPKYQIFLFWFEFASMATSYPLTYFRTYKLNRSKMDKTANFYGFFRFVAHKAEVIANLYFRPTSFSFEIPQTCLGWAILFGANPVLYMIFVFMQMYYIFMHSRINIHKNKVRDIIIRYFP